MERLMKPFRLRSSKDRKPLSEEQKRKRARFVVYPLMFLLCLGSFYLIFSPSGQERERQDKGQGFNTEIPSPEDSRLEGNKKDAYEKALMEQESRKRKTFFEAAESMFAKEERKDSVCLPDNIPPERQTNTETENGKTVSVFPITFHRRGKQTRKRKQKKAMPDRSVPQPEPTVK